MAWMAATAFVTGILATPPLHPGSWKMSMSKAFGATFVAPFHAVAVIPVLM